MASNQKYWLVHALDDDPVVCQSFESATYLAVAIRELIETNADRRLYLFSFYGDRLLITKGPERYIIIPHHTPTHYPLFGRSGEITDVDEADGLITGNSDAQPDPGYQSVTTTAQDDKEIDEEEESNDVLTEPEIVLKEH